MQLLRRATGGWRLVPEGHVALPGGCWGPGGGGGVRYGRGVFKVGIGGGRKVSGGFNGWGFNFPDFFLFEVLRVSQSALNHRALRVVWMFHGVLLLERCLEGLGILNLEVFDLQSWVQEACEQCIAWVWNMGLKIEGISDRRNEYTHVFEPESTKNIWKAKKNSSKSLEDVYSLDFPTSYIMSSMTSKRKIYLKASILP